jgi:hypothetical protein
MKTQARFKMILGCCLIVAIVLFGASRFRENKQREVYPRPTSINRDLNVNSMTVDDKSDLYCGILLMPKSMLPMLEKISQYRFAEDIKILPARIRWNDGCMVAVAEDGPAAENSERLDPADQSDSRAFSGQPLNSARKDNTKFNPVLFYYFLANASRSQIDY